MVVGRGVHFEGYFVLGTQLTLGVDEGIALIPSASCLVSSLRRRLLS